MERPWDLKEDKHTKCARETLLEVFICKANYSPYGTKAVQQRSCWQAAAQWPDRLHYRGWEEERGRENREKEESSESSVFTQLRIKSTYISLLVKPNNTHSWVRSAPNLQSFYINEVMTKVWCRGQKWHRMYFTVVCDLWVNGAELFLMSLRKQFWKPFGSCLKCCKF